MTNIIIIGCGYMGHKVAQLLNNNNRYSVYGISRNPTQDTSLAKHLRYDLDNPNMGFPLNNELTHAHILYLAPPPRKGQSDSRIHQFLKQIENNQYIPKKIVLISTTGVYGNCQGAWVTEQTPLNPKVDRALRRADAEQQLIHFAEKYQISHTILRVAGIYAEDKLPIKRLKSQQPLVRKEESPFTNRIHANDLANICKQALTEQHTGIFNCADGHPSTMFDYFSGIANALDMPQPPVISLAQAQQQLSEGMLSYMHESRRVDNSKLLSSFQLRLQYPSFDDFLNSGVFGKKS